MTTPATPEDLELDRLAAKAAGINLNCWVDSDQHWIASGAFSGEVTRPWNPRVSVLDSWFLQRKIVASLEFFPDGSGSAQVRHPEKHAAFWAANPLRAVVLAAAEIGRRMP